MRYYTFGEMSRTLPMILNNRRFHITRNLHGALTRLRKIFWEERGCIDSVDIGRGIHRIWIDAIR